MKLFLLNEYVGGTPFESQTLGIYLTIEEAKIELKKQLDRYDYENWDDNEITETSFYFDCSDWWGGCVIEEFETNLKLK